jgi:hypothetical protein
MVRSLRGKILTDPHALPHIELGGEFYLGEFPWHPKLRDVDQWISPDSWHPFDVPCRATVASYTCERGGYDYSIDRTVSIEIPAPWMAESMGLRLANGQSPIYVASTGREMFYDPSVLEDGPAAALVDRDAFLQILGRRRLSPIWVIAGEKSIYGGHEGGTGFGGRLRHTAIYYFDHKRLVRHFHQQWEHPSSDQLKEFFEGQSVPARIKTRNGSRGRPVRRHVS